MQLVDLSHIWQGRQSCVTSMFSVPFLHSQTTDQEHSIGVATS